MCSFLVLILGLPPGLPAGERPMAGGPMKCGKRLSRYPSRYALAALLRLIGAQRSSRAGRPSPVELARSAKSAVTRRSAAWTRVAIEVPPAGQKRAPTGTGSAQFGQGDV